MPDWPRIHFPLDGDGLPDRNRPVELYQHQPGRTDDLVAWCGGDRFTVNSAPAVLLPGSGPITDRVVGLGDYAARTPTGDLHREHADGLTQRYQAADAPENPPVD